TRAVGGTQSHPSPLSGPRGAPHRRSDELRSEPCRRISPRWRLHRPHSQGRETIRSAGVGADQVGADHKPQDRQDVGRDNSAGRARDRRRGDRMRRREFITLLGGAAAAWPLAVHAQHGGKVWRIGILETVSAAANAANFNAFRRGLRERGHVEGQSYVIEYRSADGRAERFADFAAELVRLPVDIIVTRGTPAVLAAKKATATIPIVMAAIGEPLGVGVVASLAQPGGNITGFSSFTTE